MASYYAGDVKKAALELQEKADDRTDTNDELMWRFDEAAALFDAGKYKQSIKSFEKCESLIKEYDKRAELSARDASVEGASAVTNPNALPYKGMHVDRVMLNAYKALAYFALKSPQDAQVELRRMRETQKLIVKQFEEDIRKEQEALEKQNKANKKKGGAKAAVTFEHLSKNPIVKQVYDASGSKANKLYGALGNPFATYFSAIGYLLEHNYSEAMVDFRNLYKMIPENSLLQRDYVTCAGELGDSVPEGLKNIKPFSYPLDNKIVYVFFFNGRAPALKQRKFQIVLPFVGYTGVAFPQYEYFSSSVKGLQLSYRYKGHKQWGVTAPVADFDAVMSQEYHIRLPGMITRIVVSTLTKEIASFIAVQAAQQAGGSLAAMGAYAATGLYKYLFNTADTRCWETLPHEIQIGHIPIPDDNNIIISSEPSAPSGTSRKVTEKKKSGSTFTVKKVRIKLKKGTRAAIVYVRALSGSRLIYRLFEIE